MAKKNKQAKMLHIEYYLSCENCLSSMMIFSSGKHEKTKTVLDAGLEIGWTKKYCPGCNPNWPTDKNGDPKSACVECEKQGKKTLITNFCKWRNVWIESTYTAYDFWGSKGFICDEHFQAWLEKGAINEQSN